ncbi:MAG TPA: hypothetical protein DCS28_03340 [Candidatus Moranbacteria bacterium]|nr:hypothetical protein [Candidatus Moranbacteria bacterium]HAT75046.1 hypothetical protein [Candidatus Moranbacteria bacterium]
METQKKRRFNLIAKSLLIVFALAFFVSPARAEDVVAGNSSDDSTPVIISTVNIYNAEIVKYDQEKSRLRILFDLYNREKAQPQIMYSVQLIKQDGENQYLIDEKVYDKIISLAEKQGVSESIAYPVPEYLSGKYKVFIKAMNIKGLIHSLAYVGEVDLAAKNTQYLEIANASCYLTIEGEESKTHYTLYQGVDIAENEKLIGNCEITNHFSTAVDFIPFFETHFRTVAGEIVSDNGENQTALHLEKNEKKLFSFTLPKALKPQAYDAQLALNDAQSQKTISNKTVFHYVLHGLGATVQNLRLDKDYYAKGETAKVSFFWSASADGFANSRLGETKLENGTLNIEVENCSKKIIQSTDEQSNFIELEIPIIKDCVNPQVVAIIKDKDGNILDQNNFEMKSSDVFAGGGEAKIQTEKISKTKTVVLIFVLLITVISLALIFIKKRNAGSLGIFLLFFLMIAATGTKEARAESVVIGEDETVYYNIDKSFYLPGKDITATAGFNAYDCSNTGAHYPFTLSWRASEEDDEKTTIAYLYSPHGSSPSYWVTEPKQVPFKGGNHHAFFPLKVYHYAFPVTPIGGKPVVNAHSEVKKSGTFISQDFPEVALKFLSSSDCNCYYDYDIQQEVCDTCVSCISNAKSLFDNNLSACKYIGPGEGSCDDYLYYCTEADIENYNGLKILYKVLVAETGLEVNTVGNGWVKSSPLGIRCGMDDEDQLKNCLSFFDVDTNVTLTADFDDGVTAINWTGCDSTSDSNDEDEIPEICTVKMEHETGIKEVKVDFGGNYKLTVKNFNNGGTGTVSDTAVPGNSCGSPSTQSQTVPKTCVWTYESGTSVNLKEVPTGTSIFDGWSSAASSCDKNSSCSVTMDGNKTAGAVFSAAIPFSCAGSVPNGATKCAGDESGLTENISWTNVASCTDGKKCEYTIACVPNYLCVPEDCGAKCGLPTVSQNCCDSNCGFGCKVPANCNGGAGCPDKQITCDVCPEPSGNWIEVAP